MDSKVKGETMKLEKIVEELEKLEVELRKESDVYHKLGVVLTASKIGVLADYVRNSRIELDYVSDTLVKEFPITLGHL